MRLRVTLAAYALLACTAISAAAAETTPSPARWTLDDIVRAETIEDFELSKNGTRLVWVKTVPHPDKDESLSHLYLTDLANGAEFQLTRGKISATRPRWSPDNQSIAFLSSRPDPDQDETPADAGNDEGKPQIWILNLNGGEPYPLTRGHRGVLSFEWRGTNALVFTAQEDRGRWEDERKEKKDKSIVTEDEAHEPPVRLFEIRLDQKDPRRLSTNVDRIIAFAVSPNGSSVLALHSRSLRFTYDQRIRPALWLHPLDSGTPTQLLGDSPPMVAGMVWSRDSRSACVVIARSSHPIYVNAVVAEPHLLDIPSGTLTPLPLAWDRGLSDRASAAASGMTGLAATSDGFLALVADGTRNGLVRLTRDGAGWHASRIEGPQSAHLSGFSLASDKETLVYLHSRATQLPQLFSASLGTRELGPPTTLTRLNASCSDKPVGEVEIVRWRGAQQAEIEGILFKPPGFRPGRQYPLVLMIHGGPHWADMDLWGHSGAYAPALFTQRGALVLQPNYQGSSSYGLAFAESIANGKYYDLPVEDILRGVDHLVARGSVDTNRLGTLGWSNGAILTMALVTRDSRFKAAAAGAGGVEWTADTAACSFGLSFNDYYFGGTPWSDPEHYRKLSPFWRMDQVRTPVLIFQGTEDDIVPPHHAWMQYRVLQELGKVPVRFIQFPGEAHSLKRLSNQRRLLEEQLAWFDQHLFGIATEPSPTRKDKSPLALAFQRAQASRVGLRFGRSLHGRLIPEVVPFQGMQVGRFEVTRAQFAEFSPGQSVQPGRENEPAAGISFEAAQAYCRWLSQLTAETWRLPDSKECEKLFPASSSDGPENTLDHWAGFSPNPEDTSRLLLEVQQLGGPGALLRDVGSFPGRSDPDGALVFDLDGNVAEWTTDEQGRGTLRGGSADTPNDPKSRRTPSPACQGFRVVRAAE